MTPKRVFAPAALVLIAAAAPGAASAVAFADLRNITAQANWNSNPDDAALQYVDWFNNNDPQSGGSYTGGLVAPASLYSVSGSVTGAETTPGDFVYQGTTVGQMRFTQANGSTPTILTVNGVQYSNSSNFIRMNGPTTANGTPTTLFASGRRNFTGSSAWDFSTPDAGMRYGMRFTDANIDATASTT